MKSYRVNFAEEHTSVVVQEGMTVMEARRLAGLAPDAPCGGQGKCGKCKILINGKTFLSCQTAVHGDITVETMKETKNKIMEEGIRRDVTVAPGKIPEEVEMPMLAAVDLGTTSLVVYLMDGKTGEQLSVKSMRNPQQQYGADVVSRCSYALENGGKALASCVREAVNLLLREAALECNRSREDILGVVMVGNSCMHHLFLEIPTDTLVIAPYKPKVLDEVSVSAVSCGIYSHPKAWIKWLPNIGGFVGADTTACILASGMDRSNGITLMVDIGTNGEMVLGNKDGLIACSTAAGPAFEGAKITCGMRGSEGAIDHVYLENGKIKYHVIGEGDPLGICGSGLLDAAACFLEMGVVKESGRMEKSWYFTPKIYINQKDIRELQLAKAAIAAGIRQMCRYRGIEVREIKQLLLAGAFGNYLNPESACAIGLLPAELKDRIRLIGNAAGEGARIAALNEKEYEKCVHLARKTEFIELAMNSEFQDAYVEELSFPENITRQNEHKMYQGEHQDE